MNQLELDYYGILDVPRSATKEQITLAYRKLAIRLCPHRDKKHKMDWVPLAQDGHLTHMSPIGEFKQWEYINMAYDVLGNDMYRSIYDRFGEAGLFQGMMLPNGYFPPYQYHGDHMRIYKEVFGSYSPYANIIDVITNPPNLYATKEHGIGVRTKDPPVEKIICLSLEEVRFGCVKLMHFWRQEFVDSKQSRTEKRKKTLKIIISAGTTAGTRYCFKEGGDCHPTRIPCDIIFIIADKPHERFQRVNFHDLIYTHEIDLIQALTGFTFFIETLDKRKLKVVVTDVVKPDFQRIIPREGLPKCEHSDKVAKLKYPNKRIDEFGDLIIKFRIKFPNYLTPEMKQMTRKFFQELNKKEREAEQITNPMHQLLGYG